VRVSTPQRHLVLKFRGSEGVAEASSRVSISLQGLLLWSLLNEWSPRRRSRGWMMSPLVRPRPKPMARRVDGTSFPTSALVWDRGTTSSRGMIRRRNRHRSTLRRLLRLVRRKLPLPLLLRTVVLLRLWRWTHLEPTRRRESRPMARLPTPTGQRNRQSTSAKGRR